MARRNVNSLSIRDRAFGLASAACPPSKRLLVLTWATEYRRYLLWCIARIEPKAILIRLMVATFRARLLTELILVARQYDVVRQIYDPKCSLNDLGASIRMEIEARQDVLLGDANCPASLAVLAKLPHLPKIQDQLAVALRQRHVDVVRGQVIVRFRSRICTIAAFYLISLSWLIFVFSQVPQIRNDIGNASSMAILAIALLTYLISPVIRTLSQDRRLREVVNQVPYLQMQQHLRDCSTTR